MDTETKLKIASMTEEEKSRAVSNYMQNNPGWSFNEEDRQVLYQLGYEPSRKEGKDNIFKTVIFSILELGIVLFYLGLGAFYLAILGLIIWFISLFF